MRAGLSRQQLVVLAAAVATALAGAVPLAQTGGSAKEQESRRPKVTLRAQPTAAVAPARVVLTAELTGGADDFQEYYCPAIEWEWGDGTASEVSTDCEPYEEGTTRIKRRYTIQHQYGRDGAYKIYFHMKRNEKIVGSASATIQVQPGGRPPL